MLKHTHKCKLLTLFKTAFLLVFSSHLKRLLFHMLNASGIVVQPVFHLDFGVKITIEQPFSGIDNRPVLFVFYSGCQVRSYNSLNVLFGM